jgi:hypothetical protein
LDLESGTVRPEGEGDEVGEGHGVMGEYEEIECEEEEARRPKVLRDPCAPKKEEIEEHCINHMPYRSWCPSCVAGKARDRPHRKQGVREGEIPEVVFDYCFLGAEGEEETLAIQVAMDKKTRMHFAHVVPRKGLTHEHGSDEMIKHLEKLGHKEVLLKCDGEPALRSVQEDVKRKREEKTLIENSPVEDSKANGSAERAVQTVTEQVRVMRHALEQRLNMKISGKHPVMTWLVEHSADMISKYLVGHDGRTAYERWRGEAVQRRRRGVWREGSLPLQEEHEKQQDGR